MSVVEGTLRIDVILRQGLIGDVTVTSSRPVQASRVFHGMRHDAALALMPRLFGVCGAAQAGAAATALEAAQGIAPAQSVLSHRGMLMLVETAQAHLWRLCMDGARLAGQAPLLPAAAAARTLLPRLHRALFPRGGWSDAAPAGSDVQSVCGELEQLLARQIFGHPPEAWCRRLAERARWWRDDDSLAARMLQALEREQRLALGDGAPAFLPALDLFRLDRLLDGPAADAFIAAPALDGHTGETTPLARHFDDLALMETRKAFGTGLATRLTALLLELARVPAQLRRLAAHEAEETGSAALARAPGIGLAQVAAARGTLVHRVQLEPDGTVCRYQILAPTEWNFHPRGVLARVLRGWPARDVATARRDVELMVQAIDPCVGYEVVVHA